jgi:hypothetical protein
MFALHQSRRGQRDGSMTDRGDDLPLFRDPLQELHRLPGAHHVPGIRSTRDHEQVVLVGIHLVELFPAIAISRYFLQGDRDAEISADHVQAQQRRTGAKRGGVAGQAYLGAPIQELQGRHNELDVFEVFTDRYQDFLA